MLFDKSWPVTTAQVFHSPVEIDGGYGVCPVEKQVVLEVFEVARGLFCLVLSAEAVQDFD